MLATALLCGSTGLMLGVAKAAPRRATVIIGLGILAATAMAMPRISVPDNNAFMAAWIAILVVAAACVSGAWASRALAFPMTMVAGAITGLLADDSPLLTALVALPIAYGVAKLVIAHALDLALRVVAGWLLAVAVLNASLALLPVTPGYLPDHLE